MDFPDSLAIVGNGGGQLDSGRGPAIDAHEHVARFNNFDSQPVPAADYGARCTIWVTVFHPTVTPPRRAGIERVYCPLPITAPRWFPGVYTWDPTPAYSPLADKTRVMPADLFDELWAVRPYPTTGFAFLWWVWKVRGAIDRRSVFGFDFFRPGERVHYWGEERVAGPGPVFVHDVAAERELARELFGIG